MRPHFGRHAITAVALALALASAAPAAAQDAPQQANQDERGRVGVSVTATTFGISGDVAVSLNRRLNIRGGASVFHYTHDFDDDDTNITYQGKLTLKSIHAYLDWFPTGGSFHISPGLVIDNGNQLTMTADVLAGQSFDLDGTRYYSSPTDPVRASGKITVSSGKPALVIGWSNIASGKGRVTVPFEIGVVFQDAPKAVLDFGGSVCAMPGVGCRSIAGDAGVLADLRAEEAQLNEDIRFLRYYPVLSIGIGVRF